MHESGTLAPRSNGLLALGIVTIVGGALYLLMSACGGASLLLMPLLESVPGAAEGAEASVRMMDDPLIFANTVASLTIPSILHVLALIAGIGLIKQQRWGRSGALGFSFAYIGWTLVSFPFNVLVIQPRVQEITAGLPGTELSSHPVMQVGGALFGVVLYLALPVALLIVLNRPNIKAQFPH